MRGEVERAAEVDGGQHRDDDTRNGKRAARDGASVSGGAGALSPCGRCGARVEGFDVRAGRFDVRVESFIVHLGRFTVFDEHFIILGKCLIVFGARFTARILRGRIRGGVLELEVLDVVEL